jgi:hypothetical protein
MFATKAEGTTILSKLFNMLGNKTPERLENCTNTTNTEGERKLK